MNTPRAARPNGSGIPHRWLDELVDESTQPASFESEEDLRTSWLRLQTSHTSFRATEQREYQSLVRRLLELEQLFLDRHELQWYYEECMRPETGAMTASSAPTVSAPPTQRTSVDQVAAIQAQLMEDVYYTLQLSRYANAPDNRGWVNLLRRWGRSENFNRRFDELKTTFSLEFVQFYELYLREYRWTIDEWPIPHPWDRPSRHQDPRAVVEHVSGVFLDSGIREVAPLRFGGRTGQRPVPDAGSGGHGILNEKGGQQGYETPSPPPDGQTDSGQ